MASVVKVTDENFEQEVNQHSGVVLVDFSAEWCNPCKRLEPIIHELAEEYAEKVKVCHIDVDNARQAAGQFGIMSVPTIIVIKGGEEVDRTTGLVPKQTLTDLLDAALA